MGEKAQARNQSKMARLTAVAEAYERAVYGGSYTPALDPAEQFAVTRATVRGWIYRARCEGLIADSNHRPRPVDWGEDSWVACGLCRSEWPCDTAHDERVYRLRGAR